MLNSIVKSALSAAGVPTALEPQGLARGDGTRPDGVTLVPWRGGRHMVWDVTVPDTYAASHAFYTAGQSGGAADSAENRNSAKYVDLAREYTFIPHRH